MPVESGISATVTKLAESKKKRKTRQPSGWTTSATITFWIRA
jgi:hypothetical protein